MTTSYVAGERRAVEDVLAEWRAAERRRDELEAGSPAWLEADRIVDRLRHEYHDATQPSLRPDEGASLAS